MYPQEERIAEAWLREHPFDETALRHLMQALHEQEMTHEAQRRYRETAALAKKMGNGLSSDIAAFAQRLPHQPRKQAALSTWGTPSSASSQPPVYLPSLNVSPQGIIGVGAANTQKLKAENLRDSYLTSSPDIVGSLRAYSSLCQGNLTIYQQQIDIYTIIEQRCTMNDEHITDLSQIGRRDLFTLAMVSQPLITNIRHGWLTAGIMEDFLSEATASVTTCWYLLRGDGLTIVELTLPQYLPELVQVVKQGPSLYRQRASYLAAQGFLLLNLIAHHHLHFDEEVAYCQEAVTYAHEARDLILLVESLRALGGAFLFTGQLDESLRTYLQAERYSKSMEIAGSSRGILLAKLSRTHAKQGKNEEVIRFQDEARATFTTEDTETPVFLSTSHGFYEIILDEGLGTIDLGDHARQRGDADDALKHYKAAGEKFGQIDQPSSDISIPKRIAAEIEIGRAKAAALEGDMDGFIKRFENGVRGAKEVGSDKRMQEAREAYILARKRWPHEQRIIDLWELLI